MADGEVVSFTLSKEIPFLVFLAMVLFFVGWISYKKNLFHLPKTKIPNPLSFLSLLVAFALAFVSINPLWLLLRPLFSYLFFRFAFSTSTQALILHFSSSILVLLLLVFILPIFFGKKIQKTIWSFSTESTFACQIKEMTSGVLCLLFVYPLSLFFSHLLLLFLYLFGGIENIPEQDAVIYIRELLSHPTLMFLAIILVTLLIPTIEEFLFRGMLQNYLKNYLRPSFSILISSFLFAFSHYSQNQKIANLPLVLSIFILSLILGLVYEKRGSLFASISLHAAYNTIGLVQILFIENR